jgi:tRNA (guanine-N7-)-methyltransferase
MNLSEPARVEDKPGAERYAAVLAARRTELQGQLDRIFSASREFTWELGSGHGHFLTGFAQAHRDKCCIGVDIESDRIARALRKRNRAQLENLFFLRAEARLFLDCLPAGAEFSDLFILFPDPWPKLRHHKHRIIQPEFLSRAAARAATTARLCFRTDSAAYFEYAQRTVRAHPRWTIVDEPWPFEFGTVFQNRALQYQSFIARVTSNQHNP